MSFTKKEINEFEEFEHALEAWEELRWNQGAIFGREGLRDLPKKPKPPKFYWMWLESQGRLFEKE